MMIRTLIVEDDAEKRKRIAEVLTSVPGFQVEWIAQEADAVSARRQLAAVKFDLLLLDIAIPDRLDQEAEEDGGVRLLEEIIKRPGYRIPSYVIGITAYANLYESSTELFGKNLFTVIQYDPTSDEWVNRLKGNVQRLLSMTEGVFSRPSDYQSELAVVCALESPELDAVLHIPWNWTEKHVPGDATTYFQGRIRRNESDVSIYAACASRKGLPAAAVLSTKMVYNFSPRYLAMPGITAGIAGRVRMGDVIVAETCWDWGSGKWVATGETSELLLAPYQVTLDANLARRFRSLARDVGQLAIIKDRWDGEKPDHDLRVRIGPVASGASVIADENFRRRIQQQHRDLLGIEMECYGVYTSAAEAGEPRPIAFCAKSVTDFADAEKHDQFQKYAAYTSARTLQLFVEKYL
jgi:nucleoside phosphorylase/CheY-like chemotaxis protein